MTALDRRDPFSHERAEAAPLAGRKRLHRALEDRLADRGQHDARAEALDLIMVRKLAATAAELTSRSSWLLVAKSPSASSMSVAAAANAVSSFLISAAFVLAAARAVACCAAGEAFLCFNERAIYALDLTRKRQKFRIQIGKLFGRSLVVVRVNREAQLLPLSRYRDRALRDAVALVTEL
jgi:hypothetical protein